VVIGSGAIGIEAAEALKKKGHRVAIIELREWIFPALFDRETADYARSSSDFTQDALQRIIGSDPPPRISSSLDPSQDWASDWAERVGGRQAKDPSPAVVAFSASA